MIAARVIVSSAELGSCGYGYGFWTRATCCSLFVDGVDWSTGWGSGCTGFLAGTGFGSGLAGDVVAAGAVGKFEVRFSAVSGVTIAVSTCGTVVSDVSIVNANSALNATTNIE